ncbi:MAG TPA: ornithine cyclodeaminase family protein [Actinomycetota bacterium]|nr:ornithine cyclodeaminase family protein [Actinomycetota bacterium]
MSSELRVIDAEELRARLPMEAAVDALEEAFRTLDPGSGPLRTHVETPAGTLLLMPAFGEAGVGVKLVSLTPANPDRGLPFIHASYVLFHAATQAPEAVLDGSALTALRTAAVSGLATRFLSREDAHRLVIFGAGVQARSHLEAMCAVRDVTDLVVVSRSPGAAEALVEEGLGRGLTARRGEPEAVGEADLVCTCTTAETPLFEGSLLPAGVHVNAVGSYQPETRELDTEALRGARVVVETREVALAEAGDLLIPIEEGVIQAGHIVADLSEMVRGAAVRRSPGDVTLFKSVGLAFEDLVVARAVVDAGR